MRRRTGTPEACRRVEGEGSSITLAITARRGGPPGPDRYVAHEPHHDDRRRRRLARVRTLRQPIMVQVWIAAVLLAPGLLRVWTMIAGHGRARTVTHRPLNDRATSTRHDRIDSQQPLTQTTFDVRSGSCMVHALPVDVGHRSSGSERQLNDEAPDPGARRGYAGDRPGDPSSPYSTILPGAATSELNLSGASLRQGDHQCRRGLRNAASHNPSNEPRRSR
jgi:hypothetical protein